MAGSVVLSYVVPTTWARPVHGTPGYCCRTSFSSADWSAASMAGEVRRTRPTVGGPADGRSREPEDCRRNCSRRGGSTRGLLHRGGELEHRQVVRARPGLSVDDAAVVMWTYTAPVLCELHVLKQGWSVERFADFTADAATSALLPP